MSHLRIPFLLRVFVLAMLVTVGSAQADVHTVRVNEYSTQCTDGTTAAQYIELKPYFINQLFRQCASLSIKRTLAGPDLFFAKPVFIGHTNDETYTTVQTFLLATPSFQATTGITPDVLIPDGILDPAGGVLRFAADSGCEPNTNWGTIHDVRYGDQGTAPAPGPGEAANFRSSTASFIIGTPTPRNFAGATATSWTCPQSAAPQPEGVSRPMVLQNSPNPFTPRTRIGYALPVPGRLKIDVFTISGRHVLNLLDTFGDAGSGEVVWDGTDGGGHLMPGGVYFYRFESGTTRDVRRMILSR